MCWFLHGGKYRRQAFMRDDMATVTWHVGVRRSDNSPSEGRETDSQVEKDRRTAREKREIDDDRGDWPL